VTFITIYHILVYTLTVVFLVMTSIMSSPRY